MLLDNVTATNISHTTAQKQTHTVFSMLDVMHSCDSIVLILCLNMYALVHVCSQLYACMHTCMHTCMHACLQVVQLYPVAGDDKCDQASLHAL